MWLDHSLWTRPLWGIWTFLVRGCSGHCCVMRTFHGPGVCPTEWEWSGQVTGSMCDTPGLRVTLSFLKFLLVSPFSVSLL